MKNLITILITLFFLVPQSSAIKNDYSLARVKNVSGKLVFYNNEPVESYSIAFSFTNYIRNYNTITSEAIMDNAVRNAKMESGIQDGKQFDAIITKPNTQRDLAIVFTDKNKDNSIARVPQINGKYIFIECNPLNNFTIVENIEIKKSTSQQDAIDQILKKGMKSEKKGRPFDGILFGSTKYDNTIKFESN